jgi:Predicted soluble lytic transglycosylase fused to an ABC-type amino acid-binding protein
MFIKIVRYLLILLVAAALFTVSSWRTTELAPLPFHPQGDTLNCTILFDDSSQAAERSATLNKALLSTFGDFNEYGVNVEPQLEEMESWSRLVRGRYDIIVHDTADKIPASYRDLVNLSVSISPGKVWAVAADNPQLLNYINLWISEFKDSDDYKYMSRRYLHPAIHVNPYYFKGGGGNGSISAYDNIIKQYSEFVGVDWRLISAIIYHESRFTIDAVSTKNARGLMQIKEATAAKYGVFDIQDPELNIKAGTLHIGDLINRFISQGMDYDNAVKFALGGYNAGTGRIKICRETAESLGYNPNVWEDVVMAFPHVPNFKGNQTVKYVEVVIQKYHQYCQSVD